MNRTTRLPFCRLLRGEGTVAGRRALRARLGVTVGNTEEAGSLRRPFAGRDLTSVV